MEPEAELIGKYDHILTTMRTQIRTLKGSIKDAEVRRQKRNDDAEELKEELIRKEFELEECVLELEEVKSALRASHKTLPSKSPSPRPAPVLSWDDLPVREDFEESSEQKLLRQKVEIAERENQVLRDKVDLKDEEIRVLASKSFKPELRLTRTYQEDRGQRGKTAGEYEREIAELKGRLEAKERLLSPQPGYDPRPSISALKQELKEELSRDVATPSGSRLQQKLDSLHESMVACNPAGLITEKEEAIVQLQGRFESLAEEYRSVVQEEEPPSRNEELHRAIQEKEREISDITSKLAGLEQQIATLSAQQQAESKRSSAVAAQITSLRTELDAKDQVLADLQDQYVALSDQCQSLMEARVQQARFEEFSAGGQTPIASQSSTPAPITPVVVISPPPAMSPAEGNQSPAASTPTPRSVAAKPGMKPAVNLLKEGVKKGGANTPLSAAKLMAAVKGKAGGVRAPTRA